MSTKLSNEHISIIYNQCKEYKILDVYIILAHISSEVKSGKYIIQSYSNKKSDLINLINKYCPDTAYKTISNCIDKLHNINILDYDNDLSAWYLKDMENMTKSKESVESLEEKAKLTGYTNIRKFFLSNDFFNMKAREKRIIIYICQLLDSKASKNYNNISINLLKFNSSWMKILKTKCKYYARTTIENMLKKYDSIFNDFTSDIRKNDIAPKTISNFKFSFTSEILSNNKEDDMLDLIKLKNPNEYLLVKDKIKFANVTLSKQKIMHIVRAIATIKEWNIKERVVQLIINKYIAIQIHHSRENIKSLPAYAAAVVKAVINEYNSFKEHYLNINTRSNSYCATSSKKNIVSSIADDIRLTLNILKTV